MAIPRARQDLGCRVEFGLAYEFATTLLDKAIGPVFGHIAGHADRRVRPSRRQPCTSQVELARMRVHVAYAAPGSELVVALDVADGATVADALRIADVAQRIGMVPDDAWPRHLWPARRRLDAAARAAIASRSPGRSPA